MNPTRPKIEKIPVAGLKSPGLESVLKRQTISVIDLLH
jgi:hypothetical protein